MDNINAKILQLLQMDGRMTILQLSKELNLSRPSVNERLKKLQERQIIQGFTARVLPEAIGKVISVIIEVSDVKIKCHKFEELIKQEPDIIECHRVSLQLRTCFAECIRLAHEATGNGIKKMQEMYLEGE